MNCERAGGALIAFHFGTLDGQERDALEAHLLGCRACLEEFLALKRATDSADDASSTAGENLGPSPASRAKLRRAVAATVHGRRAWSWWERPVAVGLAAASVLIALRAVQTIAAQEGRAPNSLAQTPPTQDR